MAIITENRFYKMNVLDDGSLEVATRDFFIENGQIVGQGPLQRVVYHPGDAVPDSVPQIVKDTRSAIHTAARAQAFRAKAAQRRDRS